MPYLTQYKHDIFISYSMTSNGEPLDGEPWVERFKKLLEQRLPQLLRANGKDVAIYLAEAGGLAYGQPIASCLDEARRSGLFLMIGSPRYLDEWPIRELRTFAEGRPAAPRLFIAEHMPLLAGQTYPSEVADRLRATFYRTTGKGAASPLDRSGDTPFQNVFADFARDMATTLDAMRDAAAPRSDGGRPFDPRMRPVLLARVTDELEEQGAELRTYLEQYDVEVLPPTGTGVVGDGFLEEGRAFGDEFKGYLEREPLVVQLLGRRGRPTAHFPDGIVAFQADAARARGGEDLLQWRDPAIDVASVADDAHRRLLAGDVAAMGWEEFKQMAVRRARYRAPITPRPVSEEGERIVFIDADHVDEDIARRALGACGARRLIARMPDYAFDKPGAWRTDYADSDCIVLIHAGSDRGWLGARARQFIKLDADRRRKRERRCVVFLGPPPPKSTDQLRFVHPRITVVDWTDGDPEKLAAQLP